MREGWLIRDGVVVASAIETTSHAVTGKDLVDGLGAVVVAGPALVVGARVARVDGQWRLAGVSKGHALHVVGFGRRAYVVSAPVATNLHADDTVEFRPAS